MKKSGQKQNQMAKPDPAQERVFDSDQPESIQEFM